MNFHIFMVVFAAVCTLTKAFEYSGEEYSDYDGSDEHGHYHHDDKHPGHEHGHYDYHGHYHHFDHDKHWDHKEHHPHEEVITEVKEEAKPVEIDQVVVTEIALAAEASNGTVQEDFSAKEENQASVKEESMANEEVKEEVKDEHHPYEKKCCPCHDSKENQDSPVAEELKNPKYDVNDAPNLFTKFINDYNKLYKDEADYKKHYDNFVINLEEINRMNAVGGSASFDINIFADLDDEEIDASIGNPAPSS